MTTALVVGRRRKGRGIGRLVRGVAKSLEAEGWHVRATTVGRKRAVRRATSRASRRHADVVVVVGGDGTVIQAAGQLAGRRTALGIVPAGTGNLLAGNLGIRGDRKRVLRTLVEGRRRSVDLGRIKVDGGTERDFAVACGIGFDAQVVGHAGDREKRRWGKLAYLASAIVQSPSIRNARHEITVDGVTTTTDAAQVFIANFGKLLPGVEPRRRIRADDGVLDVLVIRATGPVPGLLAGWEALRQTGLGESPGGHVLRGQAREVRVVSDPPRMVEVDGNVVGRTPVTAVIQPSALRVIVPKKR